MKQYPCEIKVGDTFKTVDGRVWTVAAYDGKYIYTKEGAQYAPTHPDIIGFEDAPVVVEETKQQKKSSSKKKPHEVAEEIADEASEEIAEAKDED